MSPVGFIRAIAGVVVEVDGTASASPVLLVLLVLLDGCPDLARVMGPDEDVTSPPVLSASIVEGSATNIWSIGLISPSE
jgi:hypothetical protein